jgi:lysozyme
MRRITENGLDFLKRWEKFRPEPYDDGYGYMTIGYGHLIKPGEKFTLVTEVEALNILAQDAGIAERCVLRLTKVPLADGQFDALVSLTFNAGTGAYQRSIIRQRVNRGEFEDAAEMFPKSFITSNGIKSKGLIRRRVAEQRMFLS